MSPTADDPPPTFPAPAAEPREFRALRDSGETVGASRAIGMGFATARDAVARGLLCCGATPNRLTIAGLLFTIGAGYCLARGASQQVPYFAWLSGPAGWWPALAAGFLVLSGACDMLDGAVARVGRMGTRAGGVLDSSIDRFSDMAIFIGCFLNFALQPAPNLTFQVLALLALCNAFLISYVKARAENAIPNCAVGYWLRGERFAAVLIGCVTGHVPAVLWQLAASGFLTVWRRMEYAYRAVRAAETDQPPPTAGPVPGLLGRLQIWRHPRGSVGYDVATGAQIAWIVIPPCFWPALQALGPNADPLRTWLGQ